MQIRVTGRHVDVSETVRAYAQEKFGKLTKFFDRITSIEVTLDSTRGRQHIKAVVHVEHNSPVIAESETTDASASIDGAVSELERQLKKHKEQVRNDKKHAHESVRHNGAGAGAPTEEPG